MEDIARIGFKAETTELTTAEQKLLRLVPAARGAESATDRFEKRIKQLDGVAGAMSNRMNAMVAMFGRLAAAAGAAFSIGAITRMSDEYTALSNTLKVVAGDQGNVNQLLSDLNGIAERTRSPLGATVQLYQRLSVAAGELGVNQSQLMRFTENIGLALAQQGGSAEAASGALLQLSQGMAGSIIRAEEFNSILEGAYPILLSAAKGIDEAGGSVAKLRGMMLEGRLTSKMFFDAILSQTDDLETAFARTTPTIGSAFGRLREELMLFVGSMNDATGASGIVSGAILGIANNLNTVVAVLGGVTAAIVASYVPAVYSAIASMAAWAGSFVLLNGGIMGAVVALMTMKAALVATGIGAFAVGMGLAINYVLNLADKLGGLGKAFTFLGDLASDVWTGIGNSAKAIPPMLLGVWSSVKADFLGLIATLQGAWASFLGMFQSGLSSVGLWSEAVFDAESRAATELIATEDAISSAQATATANFQKAGAIVSDAFKPARDRLAELNAVTAAMSDTTDDMTGSVQSGTGALGALGDAAGGKGGGAAGKVADLKTALELLTEEFGKLSEPFDQASSAFDALTKLQENGIIGNDAFASSLGRIEEAFMRSGGSAEQWAKIIGKETEGVATKLDELGKRNVEELGRSFIDMAVDGAASFANLAKSIIKDLLAIAWQAMVVKPLLNMMGIPFAKGGAFGAEPFAKGGAFGAEPFAKGGAFTNSIFAQPTPFKFAAGGGFGLGVMGEAGPEAVMPLTRGPNGSLGVQMYGDTASSRASGSQAAAQPSHVTIAVRPGELFEPVVESIAGNVSAQVTQQAVSDMNSQLPARVNEILDDPRLR